VKVYGVMNTGLFEQAHQFYFWGCQQASRCREVTEHGQRGGPEQVGEQRFLLIFREDLIQDGPQLVLHPDAGLGQGGAVADEMLETSQGRWGWYVGLSFAKAQHLGDDESISGVVLDRLEVEVAETVGLEGVEDLDGVAVLHQRSRRAAP